MVGARQVENLEPRRIRLRAEENQVVVARVCVLLIRITSARARVLSPAVTHLILCVEDVSEAEDGSDRRLALHAVRLPASVECTPQCRLRPVVLTPGGEHRAELRARREGARMLGPESLGALLLHLGDERLRLGLLARGLQCEAELIDGGESRRRAVTSRALALAHDVPQKLDRIRAETLGAWHRMERAEEGREGGRRVERLIVAAPEVVA